MTVASASLAHDRIVIGCSFARDVVVEPIAGQTAAAVITAMTGATATATLLDTDGATTLATATVTVTAATRTLTLSIAAAVTALLDAEPARWRVRVTTSGGAVWPVEMPHELIRALP